jgi:hypothetical protein
VTAVDYPPLPTRPNEVALLLSVFATVLHGRDATYVSAPITTGRSVLMQLRKTKRRDAEINLAETYHANKRRLTRLVRRLRRETCVVINPGDLCDVPGWTQSDYRVLWSQVIERFAKIVVFLNGWQYSNGASFEYLVATRAGCVTRTQGGAALHRSRALTLLKKAVNETRGVSQDTAFLENVITELQKLKGDH